MRPQGLSAFLLATTPLALVSAWTIGQEVQTTSGLYTGHAAKSNAQVSEYLGIKFGADTGGSARFLKPTAFRSTAKLAADKFGDDCPGVLSNVTGQLAAMASMILQNTKTKASEDCLTLNIWSKPQVGEEKKAVLLWMYGGGFNIGSSNTPLYDGSKVRHPAPASLAPHLTCES